LNIAVACTVTCIVHIDSDGTVACVLMKDADVKWLNVKVKMAEARDDSTIPSSADAAAAAAGTAANIVNANSAR